MFRTTLLSFLLLAFIGFAVSQPLTKEECPEIFCNEFNTAKLVKNIWKIPKTLTPLFEEYRDILIETVKKNNTREKISAYGQSLWATSLLTSVKYEYNTSCIHKNLMEKVLKTENKEEITTALDEYNESCLRAIKGSKHFTLEFSGCPVTPVSRGIPEDAKPCTVEDLYTEAFQSTKFEVPENMKEIIVKLIKSENFDEAQIGTTALLCTSSIIIDYFDGLKNSEDFVFGTKMYGCDKKLPLECCETMGKIYSDTSKEMRGSSNHTISALIEKL